MEGPGRIMCRDPFFMEVEQLLRFRDSNHTEHKTQVISYLC